MNVIVSTASGNVERQAPENLFVVCARPEQIPLGWLDRLFDEIRSNTSFYPILSDMESVRSKESLCIFLDSVSSSLLASPDLCEFECIRRLVTEARGLMWLSYGGTMDCENPISALHSGFLRTLRSEYTNKRYISLDLEYHNANPFTIPAANVVAQVLGTSLDFTRAKNKVDFEYAFRNDAVFIPRVCVDKEKTKFLLTNQSLVSELRPFHQSGRECQLETIKPGMLDSLTFVDVSHAYEELPDGFVEIAPRAFGLNFRDIMVAMGQLRTNIMGFECSGVVTKVSANVTAEHGLVVGDRVCALLRGHWATHTRVHWTSVAKIPSSMSFESAASIPIVYVTAYYSLHQLAKIQKGETILIHSAAGGVGQAAIQFAQLAGAKIFATVGSAEKEELIVEKYGIPREQIFSSRDVSFSQRIRQITGGIGVDVILNSLAGDLLHETWTCIAPFGRFVEIGKRDFEQNNSLQMEPFVRAASFFAVDLFQLGALKQQTTMNALQSVMSLFDAGHLRPIAPISVYPISQLEKAFRIMQAGKHLGKIVVVPDPNDLVMVRVPQYMVPGNVTNALLRSRKSLLGSHPRRLT
jgi:NADPH:quinone reductase-like Zn-dependent oxidoreductase